MTDDCKHELGATGQIAICEECGCVHISITADALHLAIGWMEAFLKECLATPVEPGFPPFEGNGSCSKH